MKKKGIQGTNDAVKDVLNDLNFDKQCFVSLNASKRLIINQKTAKAILDLLKADLKKAKKADHPKLVEVFGQNEHRVPVYSGYDIIGEVRYNQNLDLPKGNSGQPGRHIGIAHFNGGYVQIFGTQWQGEYDHAERITAEEATKAIVHSGNTELFETDFPELQPIREELSIT